MLRRLAEQHNYSALHEACLSADSSDSRVRVLMESSDGEHDWYTMGSSTNIVEASWLALADSSAALVGNTILDNTASGAGWPGVPGGGVGLLGGASHRHQVGRFLPLVDGQRVGGLPEPGNHNRYVVAQLFRYVQRAKDQRRCTVAHRAGIRR